MPRVKREFTGGLFCHVLNRGNGRTQVFHDEADYQGFLNLLVKASSREAMRIVGWCLMPNHFHLVLWPQADGDLSRFMQWLLTAQVRRHHKKYGSSGHIWQGRFKSFPVQYHRTDSRRHSLQAASGDNPLWIVVRYVERNALRAGLVARAESWRWSSLHWWTRPSKAHPIPLVPTERPANWLEVVNSPLTESELAAARNSVNRGTPLGEDPWVSLTAARLGLEHTVRRRGRPHTG